MSLADSTSTPRAPFCRTCGWRQGGTDSWDGTACKCGTSTSERIPVVDDGAQMAQYAARVGARGGR